MLIWMGFVVECNLDGEAFGSGPQILQGKAQQWRKQGQAQRWWPRCFAFFRFTEADEFRLRHSSALSGIAVHPTLWTLQSYAANPAMQGSQRRIVSEQKCCAVSQFATPTVLRRVSSSHSRSASRLACLERSKTSLAIPAMANELALQKCLSLKIQPNRQFCFSWLFGCLVVSSGSDIFAEPIRSPWQELQEMFCFFRGTQAWKHFWSAMMTPYAKQWGWHIGKQHFCLEAVLGFRLHEPEAYVANPGTFFSRLVSIQAAQLIEDQTVMIGFWSGPQSVMDRSKILSSQSGCGDWVEVWLWWLNWSLWQDTKCLAKRSNSCVMSLPAAQVIEGQTVMIWLEALALPTPPIQSWQSGQGLHFVYIFLAH